MKHLKTIFAFMLMAVLSIGQVWAADESVTFSSQGYTNQQEISSYSGTDFSIAFNKGTNSNPPKYFTSGTAIRAYGGNYFTVSSSTKTIAKIELTFGGSDGSNAITTDVNTYSNGTWTGSATSVKFTIGGTSGNRRLSGIAVTYVTGGDPDPISVTGVSLNKDATSIEVGANETLTATIVPANASNQNVTWTSSNTSVATVSNGTITAVAEGEATITVTTQDGTKTATCTVTVTPVPLKSSLIFTAACNGSGTADDNVAWTVTSDAAESTFDSSNGRGVHYGTSSKSVEYIELTSAAFTNKITKIEVEASGANTPSIDVTVGGVTFGQSITGLTNSNTKYTIQPTSAQSATNFSGAVVVRIAKSQSATGALYCKSVVVYYEEVEATQVATPEISGTDNFYPETTVSISCGTDGATIYYTTDGSDPASSSTKSTYSAPFTVNADGTTTVKAIAVKSGLTDSEVASKAFTKATPLSTMDAIFAAASTPGNQIITFSNTWVVTGVSTNGKNAYLTDGTKGLILFNTSASSESPVAGLAKDKTLSGTVTRNLTLFNSAAELTDFTADDLTIGNGTTPDIHELDSAGIAALSAVNTGSLIKISGQCIYENSKYYIKYGNGNNDKVQVYNTLYAFGSLIANANYECTGVYVQYNSTKEIAPRNADDLVKEVVKTQPETQWNAPAKTVRMGETTTGWWSTSSDGTKSFSSSNTSVATITNAGVITLVAPGTTTLTFSTEATGTYYAGNASLTLTVKAALPAGASEFSWDATAQSYSNEQVLTTVTASPNPVIVFAKGGQNDNKYYTSTTGGPAVRFYKDNSITVTAPDNKLLYQIEINFVSGYVKTLTADVEAYSVNETVGTWSGIAKEVTFSNGDGAARLTSISVIYADGTVTELEIANVAMKTTDNPLTIVPTKHNPSDAPIEYTIASEDQQYATIENGVITPHKVTTTPINVTASIAAGSNYTAASTTFTITVANKAVPTLSFPKDSYNANLGEDFTEPELTKPEGVTVKYSSSDASVSVDENTGAITLNTEGSAVITVTSVENDDYAVASTSYTLIVTDPNKDVLTAALIGKTSYADWSDKTFGSSVKYTGNSTTGTNDNAGSIQMRKSSGAQAKSGIVTTSAIGYLKSISATRKSGTNYLDVYAKNTAYTSVEDLYNSETQGTLIGTIASGAMTFADGKAYSDNYKYIGIISHSGAVYYDDITIKWTPIEFTSYTITYNAGEVSADPVVESVEEGSVISLKAANTFTAPEGKIFAGWKLDGEENVREAGSNFTVTAAATFVAQWISVYTITYTAGEGTGDDVIVPNVQAGNYELAENTFTAPSNKEFEGWKLNNTGDLLEAGANYNVIGNASFTAQWSVVKQAAGLAYATTSYIITRGNSFNAPVLTNPHSLAVTYSGNNDEVATVDAQSGAITLQGASGEVTITAISAATDYYYAGEASYTLKVKDGNLAGGWVRLTSSNGLVNGMKVIIAQHVSSGTAINAMGGQNDNNRGQVAGTLEEGKLVADEGTAIFTLVAVGENTFAFQTSDQKYLYAASSSKNYLKSQTTIDGDATWTITLSADGKATITALGDNTHNIMRYNSSSGLFSCYTGNQQDIAIYSKTVSVISGELEASTLEDYADVVVAEGAKLVIDESAANKPLGNISGDVEVNAPLQAEGVHLGVNNTMTINSTVTTPSFSISVQLGSTGQGTNVNVNTGGSIASPVGYVDMQLSDNANPDHWHSFTVPFEVDALNGIYDANTGMKLQNEENYAIMDYHGDVRANGQYGWKKYRGTLQPGTFYLITIDGESKALRFIKKEGSGYIADNSMEMTYYDGSGTSTDFGWCGVGNQNMFNGYVPQAYVAQVLNATGTAYEPINANAALSACIPFFIQVNVTVNLVMQTAPTLAPLRMPASDIERVQVTFGNEAYSDNLYITAGEDALNEYEIGKDLVKMTVSNTPNVAQIFGKAYNNKLCVVNAPLYNNQATYDLTLYAPAAGEYTITAPQMDDADVYLTLNGAVLWNISMSPYTLDLQKGNTEGYGLLLQKHNAPQIATGVDNIEGAENSQAVQKVLLNEHVYILRNGQRYDVTGKLAK